MKLRLMKLGLLTTISAFVFAGADLGGLSLFNSSVKAQSSEPTVVEITQTGCQFIETEKKDYGFTTNSAQDCKTINKDTEDERKAEFVPLSLPAGDYIFKVTNQNVPYELGFYLRGQGLGIATLPKTSGGGLVAGTTKEYRVTLKPGKYWISCPLNPTPDYPLIVS